MKVFLNLLGIAVVIGLIFLISWDRKNIRWKAVGKVRWLCLPYRMV